MSVSASELQRDGFGTLFALLNGGSAGIGFETASTTTTNAVPKQLYQKTLVPNSTLALRASIVALYTNGTLLVGKFIREFTVKRNGSGNASLVQELVPSLDYQEVSDLEVHCSVDAYNAVIMVTGMAGTIAWHALIESIS